MAENRIPALFQRLIHKITPTEADEERYRGHRKTVQTRLKSTLEASTIQPIGSFARGTALHSGSDLDLLVQLPTATIHRGGRRISPTTVLNKIRAQLEARYPDTDMRGSGPAVSVYFAQKKYMVDVVPAIFVGKRGQVFCYEIPGRDDRWILACPAEHNRFLKSEDDGTGGKLRRTCQLIKYWMRCRDPRIPLHGFTTEMFIAISGICRGASSYAACVTESFDLLLENLDAACEDPLGVSTEMTLVDTQAKLRRAATALAASRKRALQALHAELTGDYEEALRLWNIIFNGNFPRSVGRHT
jgi:predicted nucleotidyltransferase